MMPIPFCEEKIFHRRDQIDKIRASREDNVKQTDEKDKRNRGEFPKKVRFLVDTNLNEEAGIAR